MLVSHVLVPPAIEAIVTSPTNRVQAFLAAGHVCSVMGYEAYYPLAEQYNVPIVVTGFEPLDVLDGIRMTVHQLEEGRAEVENAYPAGGPARRQPGGSEDDRGRVPGDRPQLAGHRHDPEIGPGNCRIDTETSMPRNGSP